MKGFIFDLKRCTLHDGPGIRTTVFLKGCPLNCIWCHNPEGIGFQPIEWTHERFLDGRCFYEQETIGRYAEAEELWQEIQRDCCFYRESEGGVTFSGGEPLAQAPFLLNMLQHCRNAGIHTCVDTSGYASEEVFSRILQACDLLLLDLKHADETLHMKGTGVSNKMIIKNIMNVKTSSTPVWLRLPMVPGYNMDHESWNRMLTLLDEIRTEQIRQIHLLPYHHIAVHKYSKCNLEYKMSHAQSVNKTALLPYRNQLLQKGWEHVFIGG